MAKKKHQRRRRAARIPLPDGNYAVVTHHTGANGRRIRLTAVHYAEPDLKKLAKAFVELAEQLAKPSERVRRVARSDSDQARGCRPKDRS